MQESCQTRIKLQRKCWAIQEFTLEEESSAL